MHIQFPILTTRLLTKLTLIQVFIKLTRQVKHKHKTRHKYNTKLKKETIFTHGSMKLNI